MIRAEAMRRRRALRRFDKELAKGNYKAAHSLLKQLQHKPGGLLGFGSAKLVTGMEDATGSESDNSPYEDHQMCLQHEVGHFLVGYLVGVLPRSYEVPSVEDITQDKFAQGNVQFLDFEFFKEVRMLF